MKLNFSIAQAKIGVENIFISTRFSPKQ